MKTDQLVNSKYIIKNLKGYNISHFQHINTLFEKYGILDRDSYFKDKLKELSYYYVRQTKLYDSYKHEDVIDNLTPWLSQLTISIDYDYPFDSIFDVYDNFKLNDKKDKVLSATIKINPTHINQNDLYSVLYHEIKHIYDYLIMKTDTVLKENLFRDLIINQELNIFITYRNDFINSLSSMSDTMNFIGNCLFYIEKSECSAYLENIDLDYLQTLNDYHLITLTIYKGYNLNQIKTLLFYNNLTTNYIHLYNNIRIYLTKLLTRTDLFDEIGNEYKTIFKEVYNRNNFKSVLSLYIERIDHVMKQSLKLFNDRYENSKLKEMIENK